MCYVDTVLRSYSESTKPDRLLDNYNRTECKQIPSTESHITSLSSSPQKKGRFLQYDPLRCSLNPPGLCCCKSFYSVVVACSVRIVLDAVLTYLFFRDHHNCLDRLLSVDTTTGEFGAKGLKHL